MAVSEQKRERMRKWREANRERIREYNKTWLAENKEANAVKAVERNAKYYANNATSILARKRERYNALDREEKQQYSGYVSADKQIWRERGKVWKKNNPDAVTAQVARRRASQLQATPAWADTKAIRAVYKEAKLLQAVDGISRHVDHIVPLRGKKVSGLHVENNLQILKAKDNQVKSNYYECV